MRLDFVGPRTWLLTAIAAWALLSWALALFGMGGRVVALSADPGLVKPPSSLGPVPASRLGPLSQYSEVGNRPLFANDRRPKPFSLKEDPESGVDNKAFDYLLTSVLITPQVKLAILQSPDGSETVRVKLGDAFETLPAWRLSALTARGAVFDGPEGERKIELRVFDGQVSQASTQASSGVQTRSSTTSSRTATSRSTETSDTSGNPGREKDQTEVMRQIIKERREKARHKYQ